jgi:UDP-N-acetylglucosamine pyrophosphorylase
VKKAKICEIPCRIASTILTHLYSDWDRIKSTAAEQIVSHKSLPEPTGHENLNKLAVLKVNGGLGTSMGGFF